MSPGPEISALRRAMAPRRWPWRIAAALGAAILAAAYLAGSIVRVSGDVLCVRDRALLPATPVALSPGWHLVPLGFLRVHRYPAGGSELVVGEPQPLRIPTREGSEVVATLEVGLQVEPESVVQLHSACAGDLGGWLEERARALLADLIASREFAPLTRERVPAMEEAGRRRLAEAAGGGIEITALRFLRLGYEGAPPIASGPRARAGRRLLWIAVDSFDWDIIHPLIEAGRMPNLERLIEDGAWGNLQSIPPLLSPVIWTSVATGKGPDKHGIVDFVATDPASGAVIPVTSTLRKTRAFWNILSDAGASVGVVAWWASFPAEAVQGFMATDRIAYQLFKGRIRDDPLDASLKTYPPDLYRRIASLIRPPAEVPDEEVARFVDVKRFGSRLSDDDRSRVDELRTILAAASTYANIGMKLFAEIPTDVRVIYFEGPDTTSHLFMPFMPPAAPGVPPEKVEWFGRAVPEYYAFQDERIGGFVEAFADEETTILVCSDHGFKVGAERPETESRISHGKAADWHAREGIVLFSGKDIRRGGRILGASVVDLVPTLLALFGLPVGKDMDGKVLTAALSEEFLAAHPVRTIATYDTSRPASGPRLARMTEGDQELLQKLQSLGYIQQSMPTARINQGTIHLQSGDYAAAVREFESALEKMDQEPVRLNLARAYRLAGRPEEAQRQLDRLLGGGWNRAAVLTEMAALNRDRRDWEGAERLLRRALEEDPKFAQAHMHFARLYEQQERWDEALASYRKAVDLEPTLADASNQIGVILQHQGKPSEAVVHFRRAIEVNPDLAGPYNNLGLIYREMGDLDRAREILETGIAMAPKSAILHNSLGSLYHDRGEAERGIRSFEKALDLNPEYAEAVANLATVHREAGRLERAAEHLRRLLELEPDNTEARLSLALVLMARKLDAEASATLREVLQKEPSNFKALVALGKIELRRGRTPEAVALLERAGEVDGGVTRLWNDLAAGYQGLGRTQDARAALQRSLRLDPNQPEVSRRLAEIGGRTPSQK